MHAVNAMTTKQVQAAGEAVFEAVADRLNLTLFAPDRFRAGPLSPADIRSALEAALAAQFAPAGGVLLVWWDPQEGLRMNPAPYPTGAEGE